MHNENIHKLQLVEFYLKLFCRIAYLSIPSESYVLLSTQRPCEALLFLSTVLIFLTEKKKDNKKRQLK